MQEKIIRNEHENTFALVFEKGDEVMDHLQAFAKEHNLVAAHFTAIGAFSKLTLGYFERDRKSYKKISINEQVEVLSMIGNIALGGNDDEPKVHAHVVVGKSDGTAHGGHIIQARVWPTLEVVLIQSPEYLRRRIDSETGLPLLIRP